MERALAPTVRSHFAKRLKAIRSARGFARARYLAQSLGIEENRYTRYERAEVEPNLTLLYKMCDTLKVTPNELLGFVEEGATQPLGLSEEPAQLLIGHNRPSAAEAKESLTWRLAAEFIAVLAERNARGKSLSDPLKRMQDTGALFRRLRSNPYDTIAEMLAEPALAEVPASRKAELVDQIEQFTRTGA